MQAISRGISVDFKPILHNIKEMVENSTPKEDIFQQIDRMLSTIAQLEKISEPIREEKQI